MSIPKFVKTKSGTKIYITEANAPDAERQSARLKFIKMYNNTFSNKEQKEIGNVVFNYDKNGKDFKDKQTGAQFNLISKPDVVHQLNPNKKRMGMITVDKNSQNDEWAIVHEMLHVKNAMHGMARRTNASQSNEKKQDFEAVGRITKKGLNNHLSGAKRAIKLDKKGVKRKPIEFSGYYSDDVVNKNLIKIAGKNPKKQLAAAVEGIVHDRKLLTGSMNINIIGTVASSRAKKLYPKSFFNMGK